MNTAVIATKPNVSAERAWSEMRLRSVRHLVVMDGKHVAGILSERDLGGRNGSVIRKGKSVADLMTRNVVTVDSHTTIRQAANLMRGRTVGCLPVVEDGRVVGIVTITDILDQLGRGSTRPLVRAERRIRRTPAGHYDLGGTARARVTARKTASRGPRKAPRA